jgi:hypothetical protein
LAATFSRSVCLALAAALPGGCGPRFPSATARIDTGAEAVARSFFEALAHEDWSAAYVALDPTSRARWTQERFAGRAQAAMKQIGFVPAAVRVSVSEAGDEASAVAVYRGTSGTNPRQFRDGTAMRRTPQGWFVVLRNNFGIPAPPPPRKNLAGRKA